MARLEVVELDVAYGSRLVISGVSFSAEAGEVVAVIGPNGVGKTTLLKAIAGIVKPKRGRVVVDGVVVTNASRDTAARLVGYVPQRVPVAEGVTVLEYVLTGRRPWIKLAPTARDYEAALDAMRVVGIEHLAERDVSRVSGGELQLAALARALAASPRVLLLDEPTSHLDLKHQEEVVEIVKKLAKNGGVTVVVALHDLTQAFRVAERVLLLNSGRVVAEGRPEEVLAPHVIEKVYGVRVVVDLKLRAVIPLYGLDSSRASGREHTLY